MILLSPPFILAFSVLAVVVVAFQRLTSPLAKIPGPRISALTAAVLRWKELNAQRTVYIHGLHKRFGPVVRIAPNEVSFTSWAAVKEIYCSSGSGYDKTEFYRLFRVFGRKTMFSTLDKTTHAKRKRILADRYANTNILREVSISGVRERSKNFLRRCSGSPGHAHDIFMALHAYACDCITHHLFHPHGTNCIQKREDETMMLEVASDDSLQNRLLSYYNPLVHKVFGPALYFLAKPRETPMADKYVLHASQSTDAATFTLLNRLEEKTGELDRVDMAAECLDHMAAGIDTTGDGLCFLMWELSQPRSMRHQQRLQEELRRNPTTPLDQLPFLDAIVNEGLRCFPAIPMSLPRYVPAGGRTIDGYVVPEKTIVSCQAFSVHRINNDVFPQPDAFNPDRWMEKEGDTERRRLMFAFANGGRGCVGKHLALAEMKTLLRDVYSGFTTVPDAAMREESMAMSDQLISSRPLGQKCLLQFRPIEEVDASHNTW